MGYVVMGCEKQQLRRVGRIALILILLSFCGFGLASCTSAQRDAGHSDAPMVITPPAARSAAVAEPEPGNTKIINGTVYVYARNPRWQVVSFEPKYVWVRKDVYSPGLWESLKTPGRSPEEKKELDRLKERIERLEEELGKKTG